MQGLHLNATHEDQSDVPPESSLSIFFKYMLVVHSCPLEAEGLMALNCVKKQIQDIKLV